MSTLITTNLSHSSGGTANIVLGGSESATFNGLSTHAGGISVTGGTPDGVTTGFYGDGSFLNIAVNNEHVFSINPPSTDTTGAGRICGTTANYDTQRQCMRLFGTMHRATDVQTLRLTGVPNNTNIYSGLYIDSPASGTINDISYGIFIQDYGSLGATDNYSVYATGGRAYFGDGIEFKNSVPSSTRTITGENLNYYEEGTWVPQVWDAGSGGNQATVTTAFGRYTRIGNTVQIDFILNQINTTGLTSANNLFIRNVPFIIDIGTTSNSAIGSVNLQSIDFDAANFIVAAGNGGNITLIKNTSNANTGTINVSDISSGTSIIRGTLVYRTD